MGLRGVSLLWVAISATSGQQCDDSAKHLTEDFMEEPIPATGSALLQQEIMSQRLALLRNELDDGNELAFKIVDEIKANFKKLENDPRVKALIPLAGLATIAGLCLVPNGLQAMCIDKITHNPKIIFDLLKDPRLFPIYDMVLNAIKGPVSKGMMMVPLIRSGMDQLGKTPEQLLDSYFACANQTGCGDCTNGVAPCYWCARSQSCHPVGSQELGFAVSDATCTDNTCQSQWPTSTCTSAYCADGSSVGRDDGVCGGRLSCEACTKSSCFWCGISGSCHAIGSQYYDDRCTNDNCQSKNWRSTCKSEQCSEATKYQPRTVLAAISPPIVDTGDDVPNQDANSSDDD